MPDINKIIGILGTKTIAAIADEHTKTDSRELVMKLICHPKQPVKVFFFEWQASNGLNTKLSRYVFSGEDKNASMIFEELAEIKHKIGDAEPSQRQLVAEALSRNIICIAADGNYASISKEIGGEHFLAQPTGLAARDKAAAKYISENINGSRLFPGLLLLWGAKHFTENVSYGDTLAMELQKNGIKVEIF